MNTNTTRIRRIWSPFWGALLCILCACGPSDQFTGRWVTPNNALNSAEIMPNHFEMVLGQFGSDVAGVLRVYTDPFHLVGWSHCPCMYLTHGEVHGDDLSFILEFSGCPYMEALYPEKQLLVLITSESDLNASGQILDINGSQILQEFQFERSDFDMGQIEDTEKTCEGEAPQAVGPSGGRTP